MPHNEEKKQNRKHIAETKPISNTDPPKINKKQKTKAKTNNQTNKNNTE